jgi:large repetitive protein
MKKRQNTFQGATALRSSIAVMLMLVSAVLLSLAASPKTSRVGHDGSESTDNVKTTPGWTVTGNMTFERSSQTATLLSNGKVLVTGGLVGGTDPTIAELYDPATGTWSNTGSMAAPRSHHAATLLPNGKVLVTGGNSSAELYDPTTGTWSNTGGMATIRQGPTATLLLNGKVLVVGGNSGSVTTAELYDPATGTWSSAGSLGSARYSFTATLLSNGKVLIAGGYYQPPNGPSVIFDSAELYDPATGTWSNTGSMITARYVHTATLLPNGKVLVAGGTETLFGSAELYDPATGTWSSTGTMSVGRDRCSATLLPSGKVLVAGGPYISSAELYDPATGNWSSAGSMAIARYLHTATLLPNGKVLVAGGRWPFGAVTALREAELYDPAVGSWSATGSMSIGRFNNTSTLLPNGKVLVAGGLGTLYTALNRAELYDPASGTWTATGSMLTARSGHSVTMLPTGKVLVAGGSDTSFSTLNTAEQYDPLSGTWSTTGSLMTSRSGQKATLLPNRKVLVVGGSTSLFGGGFDNLPSAELYDPTSGTWSPTGSMAIKRRSHSLTLLPNGKVLVAGGISVDSFPHPTFLGTAELYDPASGMWSNTNSMTTSREGHTATLLPDGKVLVAGGSPSTIGASATAELYDPASGTWSATGSMTTARSGHTATLLANGKVLVASNGTAELYDPSSGTWSATGALMMAGEPATATLLANGKVLVAGGLDSGNHFLNNAELYDVGLGFDPNWHPLLTNVSPSIVPSGSALTVTGSRFKGISEASGGNGSQNSSSNYPLVQLLSMTNEQTLFLSVDAMAGWSDSSFTSQPLTVMTNISTGFPVGYALVTVFTNGIPSQSQFVLAAPAEECTVCHKRGQTLVVPCGSKDYRRHLDHGDTIGACPSGGGRED